MNNHKFKIGELINCESFGKIKVVDIFVSITNPIFYCYRVEDVENPFASYLANEEELLIQWSNNID